MAFMAFIQSIKDWWSSQLRECREQSEKLYAESLEKNSCSLIQVMEFNGNLYIAYNDVPVVRADRLNIDVTKLIAESRKDYLAWKKKFD